MKKNMIMAILMVTLIAGLNACCCKVVQRVVPGRVQYSDNLVQTIDEMNIKAAILVDANGEVHLYDQYGSAAKIDPCILPQPDAKSENDESPAQSTLAATQKAHKIESNRGMSGGQRPAPPPKTSQTPGTASELKVCRGMTKGSAVTSIRSIYIMKTNSDDCLSFGGDAIGIANELCW